MAEFAGSGVGTIRSNEWSIKVDEKVVMKFYDPDFAETVEGWSAEKRSEWFKSNELAAYERLRDLQGSLIPTFYGEYIYEHSTPIGCKRSVGVLLFQYVDAPNLTEYIAANLTLGEREQLERLVSAAIESIHHRGVYHRDVGLRNILWRRGSQSVTIMDFGMAVVVQNNNDKASRVDEFKLNDSALLTTELGYLGIMDKRPYDIPEWARMG